MKVVISNGVLYAYSLDIRISIVCILSELYIPGKHGVQGQFVY